MSSNVTVKVKCDEYLIRFLEAMFGPPDQENGLSFPKNHDFNQLLHFLIDVPPLGYTQPDYGEKSLILVLPYYEDKNVLSYYYLSDKKQRILVERFWEFFKITFRGCVNKSILVGLNRKQGIEIFMDKYNLPADCIDLLEKDYHRYLKVRWKRGLSKSIKNLSVKDPVCPAEYCTSMG